MKPGTNPNIRCVTLAWTLINVAATAVAQHPAPAPVKKPDPEMLADGNLRDPVPTSAELIHFIDVTVKNMVFLQGGVFEMGDWGPKINPGGLPFDGSFDSKPLHTVTLSSFSIGKHPVTYAEFDVFTAAQRLPRINQDTIAESYRKPNNPAGVTWQGGKDYCQWLASVTGKRFDLPTEAQWEYAARSRGRRHLFPTDNGKVDEGRNLPSHEQAKSAGGLVPVTSYPPNPAGVYHMSAGIHEYTNDWYDAEYYAKSPQRDPLGPATGTRRVVRGFHGSYLSAFTFKRWKTNDEVLEGTWTLYNDSGIDRKIPHTQYSSYASNAFRCVINH